MVLKYTPKSKSSIIFNKSIYKLLHGFCEFLIKLCYMLSVNLELKNSKLIK